MFDNPIYNYSIVSVLKSLGCRETKKNMFISPLRNEAVASLHIDPEKNLWYDHGAGIGGTNVQLVQLVKRCTESDAIKYIAHLDQSLNVHVPQKAEESKIEVRKAGVIQDYLLKKYLGDRKIPVSVATKYCKEVVTFNKEQGKEYRLIGFENNSGGYAMKAVSGFKSTNRSGITTINTDGERNINPSSESVAIFEGFFDFMSWLVFQNAEKPSCDVIVLNSVNNLDKAIDYVNRHSSILCFTDRDEAGRKCLDRISGLFKGKQIMDMSNLYKNYKDLNEMLVASRGFQMNQKTHR